MGVARRSTSYERLTGLVVTGLAGGALLAGAQGRGPDDGKRPEGYEQVIPRGTIAAIDDPVYVSATEARIRDDAWVLGVVVEGQARAYSLELLNSHEIVNDTIGNTDFAAVW